MDMLGTPFDGNEIPAAVPGSWSAAASTPPVPSLPQVGTVLGEDQPVELATPWDSTPLSNPGFPVVSELPTL